MGLATQAQTASNTKLEVRASQELANALAKYDEVGEFHDGLRRGYQRDAGLSQVRGQLAGRSKSRLSGGKGRAGAGLSRRFRAAAGKGARD